MKRTLLYFLSFSFTYLALSTSTAIGQSDFTVNKGILYYEGEDADSVKHKLNLFLPNEVKMYHSYYGFMEMLGHLERENKKLK